MLQVEQQKAPPVQAAWPQWQCPVHDTRLHDEGDVLVCESGDQFPKANGIPRFVPESSYADAFGLQWNHYRKTQLDSYTGTTITSDRLRRCLGDRLWDELAGKHVLECGCGAGRFTEVLLERGARVTSIDLSQAVDANQKNCPQTASHRIAQADIGQLPFAPRQFDVVICLGVVQHTPSPERTIEQLHEQVNPGGWLAIDHYTHSLSWYTKTAPLLRRILRRTADRGLAATECLAGWFLPLHRAVRSFRPAQALLSRISPVLCYYSAYPQLNDELQREWALLDTHDSLTAWYRHVRTRSQVFRLLTRLGLVDIEAAYGGIGVEARGRRPEHV